MTITAGRAAPRNESRYSAICDRARLCASSINFLPPCVVNPIDASLPTRGNRATRLSLFPLSRRTKRQLRESAREAPECDRCNAACERAIRRILRASSR